MPRQDAETLKKTVGRGRSSFLAQLYLFLRKQKTQLPAEPIEITPLTAIVLSGGGAKGACQVGMLAALIEAQVHIDHVVGVSVGALNGALFALDPSIDSIVRLDKLWRTLGGEDLFPQGLGVKWRYLKRRSAVFAAEPLKALIEENLAISDISNTQIPLHVLATNYRDGTERWFTEGDPREVLYASAALPGTLPPLIRNGETLIDGGIVNDVPISKALELGAKRIFVLLCGTTSAALPPAKRPLEAIMRSFTLTKLAKLKNDLASVPDDVDLILLDCPAASGIETLDFTKKEELIKQGYMDASRMLREHGYILETKEFIASPAE